VYAKCLPALALLGLCCWGGLHVLAGTGLLEVRPAGPGLVETEPRQIVTAVFHVANSSEETVELEAQATLPAGWRPVTRESPFELGPHQADIRLVSFFIPLASPAGAYEITYRVSDRNLPSAAGEAAVTVVVLPVAHLEAKLLEAPQYVIAGEVYRVSFAVGNHGNVAQSVAIDVRSRPDYAAVADNKQFVLQPGASGTVVVTVKTDPEIRRKLKHRLKLIAVTGTPEGEQIRTEAESWLDIVPRITGVTERFHRLPVEVTTRAVFEHSDGEDRYGVQTEISGRGTLDEAGRRHVEFLFRGPDLVDQSLYGRRDEYRLSYWTDTFEIHLGDRSYSLSPLTDLYGYGRGAEGKVILGDFALGAYYRESLWSELEDTRAAAYVNYMFAEDQYLGLNYLRKREETSSSSGLSGTMTDADVISLRGRFEPLADVDLDLEYGWGQRSTETGHRNDTAYRAKLTGDHNWGSYQFTLIHAEPDFPGYYNDTDYRYAAVRVPIVRQLRFRASYRREEDNLDLAPLLYAAPLEESVRVGVDYRPKSGTSLAFVYRDRSREDRLPIPDFDYEEETFELRAVHRLNRWNLRLSGELGRKKDDLGGETADLQRYRVTAGFRPNGDQRYEGFLEYEDASGIAGEDERVMRAGLNAAVDFTKSTSFYMDVQMTTNRGDSARGERGVFQARLNHTFPNRNELTLRVRHTAHEESVVGDETAAMIEYSIPFDLPVSRKTSVGSIRGTIGDVETGRGMANVVLRLNGTTAVSDRKGEFVFPSLKPGVYHLMADAAGIGLDSIIAQKTPVVITVRGGRRTDVALSVTRCASVSGRVAVYRAANGNGRNGNGDGFILGSGNGAVLHNGNGDGKAKWVETGRLGNVLVELARDCEIYRRVTDSRGDFTFEKVRPGQWKLSVRQARLPEYHYVEKDVFDLDLAPGQNEVVRVRILPKKRTIRIIEDGGTIVEEKAD